MDGAVGGSPSSGSFKERGGGLGRSESPIDRGGFTDAVKERGNGGGGGRGMVRGRPSDIDGPHGRGMAGLRSDKRGIEVSFRGHEAGGRGQGDLNSSGDASGSSGRTNEVSSANNNKLPDYEQSSLSKSPGTTSSADSANTETHSAVALKKVLFNQSSEESRDDLSSVTINGNLERKEDDEDSEDPEIHNRLAESSEMNMAGEEIDTYESGSDENFELNEAERELLESSDDMIDEEGQESNEEQVSLNSIMSSEDDKILESSSENITNEISTLKRANINDSDIEVIEDSDEDKHQHSNINEHSRRIAKKRRMSDDEAVIPAKKRHQSGPNEDVLSISSSEDEFENEDVEERNDGEYDDFEDMYSEEEDEGEKYELEDGEIPFIKHRRKRNSDREEDELEEEEDEEENLSEHSGDMPDDELFSVHGNKYEDHSQSHEAEIIDLDESVAEESEELVGDEELSAHCETEFEEYEEGEITERLDEGILENDTGENDEEILENDEEYLPENTDHHIPENADEYIPDEENEMSEEVNEPSSENDVVEIEGHSIENDEFASENEEHIDGNQIKIQDVVSKHGELEDEQFQEENTQGIAEDNEHCESEGKEVLRAKFRESPIEDEDFEDDDKPLSVSSEEDSCAVKRNKESDVLSEREEPSPCNNRYASDSKTFNQKGKSMENDKDDGLSTKEAHRAEQLRRRKKRIEQRSDRNIVSENVFDSEVYNMRDDNDCLSNDIKGSTESLTEGEEMLPGEEEEEGEEDEEGEGEEDEGEGEEDEGEDEEEEVEEEEEEREEDSDFEDLKSDEDLVSEENNAVSGENQVLRIESVLSAHEVNEALAEEEISDDNDCFIQERRKPLAKVRPGPKSRFRVIRKNDLLMSKTYKRTHEQISDDEKFSSDEENMSRKRRKKVILDKPFSHDDRTSDGSEHSLSSDFHMPDSVKNAFNSDDNISVISEGAARPLGEHFSFVEQLNNLQDVLRHKLLNKDEIAFDSETTCRLCLRTACKTMFPLFLEKEEEEQTLEEKALVHVWDCLPVSVEDREGFPKKACEGCYQKTKQWFQFTEMLFQTQEILTAYSSKILSHSKDFHSFKATSREEENVVDNISESIEKELQCENSSKSSATGIDAHRTSVIEQLEQTMMDFSENSVEEKSADAAKSVDEKEIDQSDNAHVGEDQGDLHSINDNLTADDEVNFSEVTYEKIDFRNLDEKPSCFDSPEKLWRQLSSSSEPLILPCYKQESGITKTDSQLYTTRSDDVLTYDDKIDINNEDFVNDLVVLEIGQSCLESEKNKTSKEGDRDKNASDRERYETSAMEIEESSVQSKFVEGDGTIKDSHDKKDATSVEQVEFNTEHVEKLPVEDRTSSTNNICNTEDAQLSAVKITEEEGLPAIKMEGICTSEDKTISDANICNTDEAKESDATKFDTVTKKNIFSDVETVTCDLEERFHALQEKGTGSADDKTDICSVQEDKYSQVTAEGTNLVEPQVISMENVCSTKKDKLFTEEVREEKSSEDKINIKQSVCDPGISAMEVEQAYVDSVEGNVCSANVVSFEMNIKTPGDSVSNVSGGDKLELMEVAEEDLSETKFETEFCAEKTQKDLGSEVSASSSIGAADIGSVYNVKETGMNEAEVLLDLTVFNKLRKKNLQPFNEYDISSEVIIEVEDSAFDIFESSEILSMVPNIMFRGADVARDLNSEVCTADKSCEEFKSLEDSEPFENSKLLKDHKHLENFRPLEASKSFDDYKSFEDFRPVEDPMALEDYMPLKDSMPLEDPKNFEDFKPLEASKSFEDYKSCEDSRPLDNSRSCEDSMSVEDSEQLKDSKPLQAAKSFEDSKPLEDSRSSEDLKLLEDFVPFGDSKALGNLKPLEESKPLKDFRPLEESRPLEDSKTFVDSELLEDSRPLVDSKSCDEDPSTIVEVNIGDSEITATPSSTVDANIEDCNVRTYTCESTSQSPQTTDREECSVTSYSIDSSSCCDEASSDNPR